MKLPLATSLLVLGGRLRGGNASSGPKIIRGSSKQSDAGPPAPTATQQQQRRRPVYIGYCMGCAALDFEAPAHDSPPANVKSESPQQATVDTPSWASWVTDDSRGRIIPTLVAPLLLPPPVAVESRAEGPRNLNDDETRVPRDEKRKRRRSAQAGSGSEAGRATEEDVGETKNDGVRQMLASLASIAFYIIVLADIIVLAAFGMRLDLSKRDKDLGEFDDLQLELSPTYDSEDEDEAEEASAIVTVVSDDDSSSVSTSTTSATGGMVREQGVRVSFASEVEVVVLPTLSEEDDCGLHLLETGADKDMSEEGVEAIRSENQDAVDNEDESTDTYDSYERFLDEVNYSVGNF